MRLTLLALVLLGLLLAARAGGGLSRTGIEQLVGDAGPLAPLAFVVVYALLTVMLVPAAILTAAGGVLFGAVLGTALTVVGATAGATAAFLIARGLGRRQVEQLAGRRLGRLDDWLAERGFVAVLSLRLIPVFPFSLSNYVVGVTGVRLGSYALATALGIVPGTFAYASLGGSIDDPTSPQFLGAAALLLALVVGGSLVQRRLRRRGQGPPPVGEKDR